MSRQVDSHALLGLDIGTTSCKLGCYAADGRCFARATAGYVLSHPQPGFAELDPADILAAVRQVLAAVAPELQDYGRLAMAISAQGEAFALVDADGRPLAPFAVSVDMRGRDAIAELKNEPAAVAAAAAAGQGLTAISGLAKLLWYRSSPDRLLDRTNLVLCVGEFVMRHLGLTPAMDHSMAARLGLLDVTSLRWDDDLLAVAGVSERQLPSLTPAGRPVGTVPAGRLSELGLDREVDLYAGGHDQACAMLGAGIADEATALYSIGTTEAIGVPSARIVDGLADLHIYPYPHVVEGQYVVLFGSQHGGRAVAWLAGLAGTDVGAVVPERFSAYPSAITVVPHLAGSGTVFGDEDATATVAGFGYDTAPADLVRAFLEGIAMEQALALSRLRQRGIGPTGLRAVGGGARSDAWMQMRADMFGLPIDCLEERDTACAGAAVLAGVGAGVFASVGDGVARMAATRRSFVPRRELREVYDLKMALYERTYLATYGLRRFRNELDDAVRRLADNRETTD